MPSRPQLQFAPSREDTAEPTHDPAGPTRSVAEPSSPPAAVMVMNLYSTGIGIARNLRSTGVPIHGISSEPDSPGMRYRLFSTIHRVPNSRDDPEALAEQLLTI